MSTNTDTLPITSTDAFRAELAAWAGDDAVAVASTDLDDFAVVNETYGHDAGDEVLQAWDRVLRRSLPEGALVRRLGGDEYVVALRGASAENALILLEEIRTHLADHPVGAIGAPIHATFGVAARPPHAEDVGDLVACANSALMRGKREGGDRVTIYVEEKMVLKSNYYPRADLDRLSRLAGSTERTEASLLREALADLFEKYRSQR